VKSFIISVDPYATGNIHHDPPGIPTTVADCKGCSRRYIAAFVKFR
jgi:hypothetical protein